MDKPTSKSFSSIKFIQTIFHLQRLSLYAFGFFFLILLASIPVTAKENKNTIDWDDLVPKMAPLNDPFKSLNIDQQFDLKTLISMRDMIPGEFVYGIDEDSDSDNEKEIRQRLSSQGVDVDAMVGEYDKLVKEITVRNKMTVNDLDGKIVRIPGYTLPLEYTDTSIKELLLVPYLGACIHTPPPPPNQTVFVELEESYAANGLYEAVWITGRMKVKNTSKSLSYVDGSAGIDVGYILEGIEVEPYEFEDRED